MLAYSGAAAIEQLLRGWATECGVTHLKVNGQPISSDNWLDKLPLSSGLVAQVRAYFESTRNRVVHGGLLEVESKRVETTLMAASFVGVAVTSASLDSDRHSSKNIALHTVEVLEMLWQEAVAAGFKASIEARDWETALALDDSEVDFGISGVSCDFLESKEAAEEFRSGLSAFMAFLTPVHRLMFQAGLNGWVRQPSASDRFLSQHLILGMLFEGIYRIVSRVLGLAILQRSRKGGEVRFQYRMLSNLAGGLYSDDVRRLLLEHVPERERAIANRVLALGVKARNATAHGARPPFTDRRRLGEGHILIKAIQLLQGACVHHMTRENAYFRWKHEGGDHLENWHTAEDTIARRITDAVL